ncbi:MAG: ankyrin repeat domain-containing protein, partial [Pseudomonadota bacterium]
MMNALLRKGPTRNWPPSAAVFLVFAVLAASAVWADDDGRHPLFDAASAGNVEIVKQLIASGADVNTRGFNDTSPLSFAAWSGRVEVMKLLLDAGARIDYRVIWSSA